MRPSLLLSLFLLFVTTGCGTIVSQTVNHGNSNLVSWHGPYYRGIATDLDGIAYNQIWMLADLPLSLAADTVLVPFIAVRERREAAAQTPLESNQN